MKRLLACLSLFTVLALAGCADDLVAPEAPAEGPDALTRAADRSLASINGRWSASDRLGTVDLDLTGGPEVGSDGTFRGEAVIRSLKQRHRFLSVSEAKINGEHMTLTLIDHRDREVAQAVGSVKEDLSAFQLRFVFENDRARVLTFERL